MNHVIENARIRAEIDPSLGARLHQLTIDGLELLGPDGCFPMVPWAGRIRDGLLHVNGETHELPRAADGNAIHGLGRKVEWEHVGDSVFRRHIGAPWPTEGTAELRYTLLDDGLRVELGWDDGSDLPCSIGLHPWFKRRLATGEDVDISLDIDEMVERGADGLPTGHLVAPKEQPWDDCFRLGSSPVVTWPGALQLTLSASTPWWVVFTEREHLVCAEPQTAPPDAFDHPSLQPGGAWPRHLWFEMRAAVATDRRAS
ncbi:aldose 1-epimerase [Aeromicrobium chenweiae]|uniref:aldose 1-epimerase n=1 Tax=Aeromicrobium chenweiae TaxID=2079793 RepID=UPI00131EEFFB|nr:hypothetical protein [Aeromicrobium chenweiae]